MHPVLPEVKKVKKETDECQSLFAVIEMFRSFVRLEMTRTGIDYQKGSHQFLNWWQQYATGILHLDGFDSHTDKQKKRLAKASLFFGDPYGNRTHVTAVKGRCLNRLTNGPGSGDLTRTGDRPGMNRVLYQLSYAAMLFRFRNQLHHYNQGMLFCQAFFEGFFIFFWESSK